MFLVENQNKEKYNQTMHLQSGWIKNFLFVLLFTKNFLFVTIENSTQPTDTDCSP